jgi:hypothetical protein
MLHNPLFCVCVCMCVRLVLQCLRLFLGAALCIPRQYST